MDETLIENVQETVKKNKSSISSQTDVRNRTRLQSDLELKNVRVDQVYFSEKEGVYYALAVLDRPETATLLEQDFNENNDLMSKNFEASQKQTDKLHRLASINRAMGLLEMNKVINEKYKVISGGQGLEMAVDPNRLLDRARAIRQAIRVKISGQDELADYLRELMAGFGFSIANDAADLEIHWQLTMEPTQLQRNDVVALNWHLALQVRDLINNVTLTTYNLKKRSVAISESEAKARVFRTIRQELDKNFYKRLIDYFNGF